MFVTFDKVANSFMKNRRICICVKQVHPIQNFGERWKKENGLALPILNRTILKPKTIMIETLL